MKSKRICDKCGSTNFELHPYVNHIGELPFLDYIFFCKECGEEYWSYGGEEKHYAEFPKKYIYMDDKDIQKIVAAELKKKEEEESREKAKTEKLKTEREKAEYERLKKIYG